MMLVQFTFLLFTASFIILLKDTNALFCFSCESVSGQCSATYCSTVVGGYCGFQRVYDGDGIIQQQVQTCLREKVMMAGNDLISTVGYCVESISNGQRYQSYICNGTNLCNMESHCVSPPEPPPSSTIAPPTNPLECFKCDEKAENCQSNKCTTNLNGYCGFQRRQTIVNGGVEFRSIKNCLPRPLMVAPDGQVINTVNRCIHTVDAEGNKCDTLICNSSNFCNNECIPYIDSSSTTTTPPTTTSSARSINWLSFLMVIPIVMASAI